MRCRRVLIPTAGLALGFVLSVHPASAMTCRPWTRLSAAEKQATVEAMIDDALQSHEARKWDINRGAVGRCLHAQATEIAFEFDDVCSDSRTADMQAIQSVFKSYIWSCAG